MDNSGGQWWTMEDNGEDLCLAVNIIRLDDEDECHSDWSFAII